MYYTVKIETIEQNTISTTNMQKGERLLLIKTSHRLGKDVYTRKLVTVQQFTLQDSLSGPLDCERRRAGT